MNIEKINAGKQEDGTDNRKSGDRDSGVVGQKDPFRRAGLARTPPSRTKRTNSLPNVKLPWDVPDVRSGAIATEDAGGKNTPHSAEDSSSDYGRKQTVDAVSVPFRSENATGRSSSAEGSKVDTKAGDTNDEEVFVLDLIAESPIKMSGTKPKRMRENSNEDMDELKRMFVKLKRAVKDMAKEVHQNTRVEIKKAIKVANGQVDEMSRKWDKLAGDSKRSRIRESSPKACKCSEKKSVTEIGAIQAGGEMVSKRTSEASTQVHEWDIQKEVESLRVDRVHEIRKTLETGGGFETLKHVIDLSWPGEAFTKTRAEEGDPAKMGSNWDVVVFADGRKTGDRVDLKSIFERYPDFAEMVEGERGTLVEHMRINTKVTRGDVDSERERYLFSIPSGEGVGATQDAQALYKQIEECRDLAVRLGRRCMIFVFPDGGDEGYGRKILEYVFQCVPMDIKVKVAKKGSKLTAPGLGRKNKQEDGTIVVKKGEKTFAELVKSVKENVSIERLGVRVKSLKKTSNGDLLLKVEGDREMAGVLKKEIQQKMQGTQVTVARRVSVIFITDIDVSTTQEDVSHAIKAKIGVAQFEIKSMKPTRDGNQVATVEMPRKEANDLSRHGVIKIGWIACRIRLKERVQRCYRCLDFGHTQRECKGADRSNTCLKCGKEGHRVKECSEESFCNRCGKKGHRADSSQCPHYRSLLNRGVVKLKGTLS